MSMNWADRAITLLKEGHSATVVPRGPSMQPKVISGARVDLEPVSVEALEVGDIVLCSVNSKTYLHLVKAKEAGRVLIGNTRGGINGWTRTVYGRATKVENP